MNVIQPTISLDHVKALRKELFQNRGYDPMARPVLNYTHSMNVSLYLDINYIKKLVRIVFMLKHYLQKWIQL